MSKAFRSGRRGVFESPERARPLTPESSWAPDFIFEVRSGEQKASPGQLLRDTLDMLTLKTLARGAMHGYAIAEFIEQTSEEVLRVEEGALYPALHRLELRGLLASKWGVSENKRRAKYYRDMWTFATLETLGQDIRFGLRQLRRNPGFTAVAALTLALGIGANTAIFSLIDAVLLKMLPVQNPQELVLLNWSSHGWPEGIMSNVAGDMYEDKTGRMTSPSFSYAVYDQMRTHSQVFSSVLALAGNGSQINLGYHGEPGRAEGELVSGTFFSTLGVKPILGRAITPEDDRFSATPVAVISYGYWERRFGGDTGIVGRKITVNAVPFTIAGVCPLVQRG
jgi:hypothetical protein